MHKISSQKSKTLFLMFLGFFVFVLLVRIASAQIVISEIMYDLDGSDSKREWVEVLNSGSSDVDISTWYFYEGSTNHGLSLYQGPSMLSAGEYAIIADDAATFLSDWSSYADILFDSSFSLKNTGEALEIRDENKDTVDQVDYTSNAANGDAAGDGNSLQDDSGTWTPDSPTPGSAYSGGGGGGGSEGSGGSGSQETQQIQQIESEEPSYSAEIIASSTAVAGVPTEFRSKVTGLAGENLTSGKYFWNLGDFVTKEETRGAIFKHIYSYPGDYVVILEYSKSSYAREPDATDRATVKVVPATIEISNVGTGDDFFISLTNTGNYEMDMSDWSLRSDQKSFAIPKNTIILANKSLTFPSGITGFTEQDKSSLTLHFPSGTIAFSYNTSVADVEKIEEISSEEQSIVEAEPEPAPIAYAPEQARIFTTNTEIIEEKELASVPETENPGPSFSEEESLFDSEGASGLAAAAGAALPLQSEGDAEIYKWMTALLALVVVALGAVFTLRKKPVPELAESEKKDYTPSLEDEIEILE